MGKVRSPCCRWSSASWTTTCPPTQPRPPWRPCWGGWGCWGRPSSPPSSGCAGWRWAPTPCPTASSSRPHNTDCNATRVPERERREKKNLCNGASLSVLDLTFAFTLGSVQFILSENDIFYWRIFRLFANISGGTWSEDQGQGWKIRRGQRTPLHRHFSSKKIKSNLNI